MSQEEILNMFRQPILPDFERMVRKDSTGKVVTLEELQADTTYDKFADYFADENGVVQELVFRQKTAADEVFIKKMETVFKERRHGFDIELMDVDCGDAKILLEEALIADQDNRKGEGRNDDAVELNNQQVVFSIIEKCGFPRKSELGQKAVDGAFYVLQHAGHKHRVKYFPLVQESVKRGDLELKQLAMMEDRILTREGKRQKYGTQITRSGDGPWVLRPIADVKNVNERRAAVGLEPIEEYLERNGIEFDLVALEKKWQSEGK
ncbi:MAG: DUF6624 domain-containing protein [Bacteroidota bacterium]